MTSIFILNSAGWILLNRLLKAFLQDFLYIYQHCEVCLSLFWLSVKKEIYKIREKAGWEREGRLAFLTCNSPLPIISLTDILNPRQSKYWEIKKPFHNLLKFFFSFCLYLFFLIFSLPHIGNAILIKNFWQIQVCGKKIYNFRLTT